MASNSFGNLFKITTWGESHGKAIGVVIDGCPAGLEVNEEVINSELALRAPGQNPFTSPRKEKDHPQILSGVFEGKTTGTPICIVIQNQDFDSSKYESIKNLLRPGHANYTYLEKYGIFDHRGGGRSSARETVGRVAAGAIAKLLIKQAGMDVLAYVKQIGSVELNLTSSDLKQLREDKNNSSIACPDVNTTAEMIKLLEKVKNEGDSLGAVVEFIVTGVPVGIGDPVYQKLEASLASAMMSLPATKGFELGSGFQTARMTGSEHNDEFFDENGKIFTRTNHAGGVLGGISTGMPIIARVAFKPTSSIKKMQSTVNLSHENASFQLPEGSRHDPCVGIRAVPIVEAMVAIVLADAWLMNRLSKL